MTTDPRIAALAAALPCEDPEEPCDADGRDEHRWCDNCIARHAIAALPDDWCGHGVEIKDLYDRLADEGYKDGIRLAEAVNEVVLHRRGTIEEAWKYGDEQRDLLIKAGREIIAAEVELARLRAIEEAARPVLAIAAISYDGDPWFVDEQAHIEDAEGKMDALRAALEAER